MKFSITRSLVDNSRLNCPFDISIIDFITKNPHNNNKLIFPKNC